MRLGFLGVTFTYVNSCKAHGIISENLFACDNSFGSDADFFDRENSPIDTFLLLLTNFFFDWTSSLFLVLCVHFRILSVFVSWIAWHWVVKFEDYWEDDKMIEIKVPFENLMNEPIGKTCL